MYIQSKQVGFIVTESVLCVFETKEKLGEEQEMIYSICMCHSQQENSNNKTIY